MKEVSEAGIVREALKNWKEDFDGRGRRKECFSRKSVEKGLNSYLYSNYKEFFQLYRFVSEQVGLLSLPFTRGEAEVQSR